MENGELFYRRLKHASDTDIRRQIKIKAEASLFDEQWQLYFEERQELKGRRVINGLYYKTKRALSSLRIEDYQRNRFPSSSNSEKP